MFSNLLHVSIARQTHANHEPIIILVVVKLCKMITVRSKKDFFFKQEPHARANVSFDQNHLCKLTVENDPSPKIFPNLKSSGLFFLIGWDDVDDNDGEAGDWGEDDEEFGVACFSKSKKTKNKQQSSWPSSL